MWNWLKPSKSPPIEEVRKQAAIPPTTPPANEPSACRIIVITGSSGSGRKSTAKQLSRELGIPYILPYTTRGIRPKEQAGEHYRFVTDAEFQAMAEQGVFFQHVRLARGRYGILEEDLTRAIVQHRAAIVVVNREGAEAFRQRFGSDVIRIFLYVTKDDIRLRLEREAAPPDVVEEYLRNYPEQVIYKKESEFLLQNLEPAATVRKIRDFLREKQRI